MARVLHTIVVVVDPVEAQEKSRHTDSTNPLLCARLTAYGSAHPEHLFLSCNSSNAVWYKATIPVQEYSWMHSSTKSNDIHHIRVPGIILLRMILYYFRCLRGKWGCWLNTAATGVKHNRSTAVQQTAVHHVKLKN